MAFSGPGFLVAVGYMDPGNWATDLAEGAIRLPPSICHDDFESDGDFASAFVHQVGRRHGPRSRPGMPRPLPPTTGLVSLDSVRDCNRCMRFGRSGWLGYWAAVVVRHSAGVGMPHHRVRCGLAVLYLQNKGFRYVEALVVTLIVTIGGCFALELFFSKPSVVGVALGFIPGPHVITNQKMLYVSIGILGATVMPHNLYLHSSIVQTRKFEQTPEEREAIKFATIDSSVALMFALFINAAILILSAAAFHWSGHQDVAEIQDAYKLLTPLLGVGVASILFAIALLASGQNSTLTGTLAGQIVMEGFQYPNHSVAAPPDNATHSDRARNCGDRCVRRRQDDGIADRQPGLFEHATRVRGVAVNAIYR